MSKKEPSLESLEYPVYAIASVDELLFVGGGGGTAKTGVKNGIAVFKRNDATYEYLTKWQAPQEDGAVANIAIAKKGDTVELACGTDAFCQLLEFTKEFKVKKKFKTVEAKDDPHQKCVEFVQDGLVTGGSDGNVKLWKSGDEETPLGKHGNPIDQVSCVANKVAAVSADLLTVHDSNTKETLMELEASFLRCVVLGRDKSEPYVFVSKQGDVQKYEIANKSLHKTRLVTRKKITALVISTDGRYIAYGTNDGNVGLLDSLSLKRRWSVQAHQMPVTCLTVTETQVISAGIDQRVVLTRLDKKDGLDIWTILIALLAVIIYYFVQRQSLWK
jgi:WD40 repeat protein